MDRFDIGESCEVLRIEGENALYVVDVHRSDEAGVVDLGSGDAVVNEESAPPLVDCEAIGEELDFDSIEIGPAIGLFGREAVAIPV